MASTRGALQWLLVFFNIFNVIIAISAIAAGSYHLDKFTRGSPQYMGEIVQLIAACVLLVSAVVGCCGAAYNSIPTLVAFIIIFLIMQLAHTWKLLSYDEEQLARDTETLVAYKWIEHLDKQSAMQSLEKKYECCGKQSFTDYTSVGMFIPESCYKNDTAAEAPHPFEEGCTLAMKRTLIRIVRFERIVHWSMIGYEILGILLASLLIWRIVSKQRRYHYY